MNGITRRRFGQLALASTATVTGVAVFGSLAKKTSAQTAPSAPSTIIYGLSSGPLTTNTTPSPVDAPEVTNTNPSNTTASIPIGLILQSVDVATGEILTVKTFQFLGDGITPILQTNETVGGFAALADGTFVVTITPASGTQNETSPTRLTLLNQSPINVPLSGLSVQEKLDSLVSTSDGGLLGLVLKKNSTPPVRLVDIDIKTGQITTSSKVTLPDNQRFSNLTQCQDGTIYTTTIGVQGDTTIVRLDQQQKQLIPLPALSVNGKPWNNGLQSLVCSATNQLLVFGALRYVTPNSIYSVNTNDGTLSAIAQFNVSKITMTPTPLTPPLNIGS